MSHRTALLALAALPAASVSSVSQIVVEAPGIIIPAPAQAQPPSPEGGPAPDAAGQAGELDFNKLRQLIEQSRERPQLTLAQQKLAMLAELPFNRSTTGILAMQLEEARSPETAAPAVPENDSPEQELQRFQADAAVFQRDVVLGRWDRVRAFLEALPEETKAQAYQLVLGKLSNPVQVAPPPELVASGSKPHAQPAFLPPADLLGLAAASPVPPQKKQLATLAKFLPATPRPPQEFFDALAAGIRHFGGEDAADRRRAAELLLEAGLVREAGPFLPDPGEAKSANDHAAMNLIARHRADLFATDRKLAGTAALPLAWELSTSFLTDAKAPAEARAEALFRALSLIPQLADGTGREWLKTTFSDPKGEGLELLASLGTLTAQTRENPDEKLRLEQLRLQHAAVQALISQDDADASAWAGIFTLFARQWAYEAGVTREKDQSDSRMVRQFDEWGNMFFGRPQTGFQGQGARPISSGELLECQPDEAWLQVIETATRNECLLASARLLIKVKEESKALPLAAILAASHREEATSLVREIIRVWKGNHNPNEAQDMRSQYFYFYGYNNQAATIPLTRSKQERNLVELAELVRGIRSLELDESFHVELADAFISCHSRAEVWRVESVESVFGATDALDSKTLATLVGRMRLNLAGLWPNPKLQQDYKTNRKDKELQEQILFGYQAADGVLERALAKDPQEPWRLQQQLAALKFEESNYRSTLAPDNRHSSVKRAALADLATAAAGYTATLPLENPAEETSEVFETWFFAALGSPTLEALKAHHVATPGEYPLIAAALEALPAESKARHLKSFASTLNSRLTNVSPDLKLRYLEAASSIAGEHEALKDAAAVLAYYRDLVTEIQLSASLDGSDRVAAGQPFGLRVNIRHTREIERESGGFQRYLQNQTGSQYAYNFGRPQEDYRDKFEKASRAVLEEHFEVVSLTFHSDKVESRTDPQFGWRLTPYAYFLLKAKGPQIDRIPPLKIDLDFTDTSGYVVLPISSSEIPLDASGTAEPRPSTNLRVTQTLDERSHGENGSLFLEIKATSHGLVPPLEELLDLEIPGLAIGQIEDRELRVAELDALTDELAPVSEHEWRIELKPVAGTLPASFRFPAVKPELAEEDGLVLQRYDDVDLLPVTAEVALGVRAQRPVGWIAGGLAALLAATGGWVVLRRRKPLADDAGAVAVPLPSRISVVSVIGYLRRLQDQEGISAESRKKLAAEIASLQARHFGRADAPAELEELEKIARHWQTAA